MNIYKLILRIPIDEEYTHIHTILITPKYPYESKIIRIQTKCPEFVREERH